MKSATPATPATPFWYSPYRAYMVSPNGVASVASVANLVRKRSGRTSRKTDQKIGLGGRSFFLGFRDRQSARVQHAVQHEKGGARNILIEQCKNDTVHRIANPVSQIRQQIHER